MWGRRGSGGPCDISATVNSNRSRVLAADASCCMQYAEKCLHSKQ